MSYEKQTFVDWELDDDGNVVTEGTTLSAEHLRHIEDGIAANAQKLENTVISLTTEQVNALDALFKMATYGEDVSEKYYDFLVAFGLNEPYNPPPVVVQDIKMGVVGFDYGFMSLNTQNKFTTRATVLPIGMYLKNGTTYKFSIGSLESKYKYGVVVFDAKKYGMEFPYVKNGEITLYNVTERLSDSGWKTNDYTYTVNQDYCILGVNFALISGASMNEDNHKEILANFTVEEIEGE